jgi:hypothetical protein
MLCNPLAGRSVNLGFGDVTQMLAAISARLETATRDPPCCRYASPSLYWCAVVQPGPWMYSGVVPCAPYRGGSR